MMDEDKELRGGNSNSNWGTWEELLLGGAVLRHGRGSWHAVASELRLRAPPSSSFSLLTPLECQVKYEDIILHHYSSSSSCNSSSSAWFEELRKRRVAELKRQLEKSQHFIGFTLTQDWRLSKPCVNHKSGCKPCTLNLALTLSLQSKLESLTSERETGSNFGYNTGNAESTSPLEGVDGINSSTKEITRDKSSAGSFTDQFGKDWTHKCQNNTSVSVQENDFKMRCSEDFPKDQKFGCGFLGIGFGIFRKKRGKRKRKGCDIRKEGCAGDSDVLSSAAFINREQSAEGCTRDPKLSTEDSGGTCMGKGDAHLDLAKIMDLIMKHEDVSIFRCRLESQKRARYKKMIHRHVDFRNIRSRIANGSISSIKELFRDLLLLCNSVLVFYPKNSTEHKSALVLRDLVNNSLRWSFNSQGPTLSYSDGKNTVQKEKVKPKKIGSALKHRIAKNSMVDGEGDATPANEKAAIPVKAEGTQVKEKGNKGPRADVAIRKQGIGRVEKGGLWRKGSPNKGRKKARK